MLKNIIDVRLEFIPRGAVLNMKYNLPDRVLRELYFFAQKYSIEKPDNFTNCLAILSGADFKLAETNDIYRTGIIGQFNITFELAWKALQEIMRISSGKRAAV